MFVDSVNAPALVTKQTVRCINYLAKTWSSTQHLLFAWMEPKDCKDYSNCKCVVIDETLMVHKFTFQVIETVLDSTDT